MGSISLFIADYDRTITDENLMIDEACLSNIGDLKERGVHTSIVTGRKKTFMESFHERFSDIFDSIICENGCIAYLNKNWHKLAKSEYQLKVIERFANAGIEFDHGECIVSTEALSEDEVVSLLSGISGWRSIVNVDSVMILPEGVDKGSGIRWLQESLKVSMEETAGIGDGENDMVMRERCGIFGTPASAVKSLRDSADFVSSEGYSNGTIDFLKYINERYTISSENEP